MGCCGSIGKVTECTGFDQGPRTNAAITAAKRRPPSTTDGVRHTTPGGHVLISRTILSLLCYSATALSSLSALAAPSC